MQYIHKTFKLPELSDEDVAAEDAEDEVIQTPIKPDPQEVVIDPLHPDKEVEEDAKKNKKPLFKPAPTAEEKKQLEEKKKFTILAEGECLGETGYKPFRKLTVQEDRSDFEKLNQKFNVLQSAFESEMKEISKDAISKTVLETKSKLATGDYSTIGAVGLDILARVRGVIKSVIADAHNFGRGLAVEELEKTIPGAQRPPLTDKGLKLRDLEAEDLTDGFVDRLETAARSTAINAINADASDTSIVAAVRDSMQNDADRMTQNISGTVVGQSINRGRLDVFNHFIEQIQKFQRSEVIDSATCEMCMSLDGRVVNVDDPVANMDLVHTECRGVWVPIMVDDEQPPLDPVPKSIMDNFDTVDGRPVVNAFKNLKKPVLSKETKKK